MWTSIRNRAFFPAESNARAESPCHVSVTLSTGSQLLLLTAPQIHWPWRGELLEEVSVDVDVHAVDRDALRRSGASAEFGFAGQRTDERNGWLKSHDMLVGEFRKR